MRLPRAVAVFRALIGGNTNRSEQGQAGHCIFSNGANNEPFSQPQFVQTLSQTHIHPLRKEPAALAPPCEPCDPMLPRPRFLSLDLMVGTHMEKKAKSLNSRDDIAAPHRRPGWQVGQSAFGIGGARTLIKQTGEPRFRCR